MAPPVPRLEATPSSRREASTARFGAGPGRFNPSKLARHYHYDALDRSPRKKKRNPTASSDRETRSGLSANTMCPSIRGCTLRRHGAADPPEIAVRMGP